MRNQWSARHVAILVLFALGLSACSPPEPGRVVQDLAFDTNGQLTEIDRYHESSAYDSTDELSQVGRQTEACLDDGTCIRLVDERQIIESRDGWESSTVVWSISPSDTFWGHEYNDGFNRMVIGLYDIVVLPDQTIAVASGQLPLIERSVDGEWSPSVASLRTLPGLALPFAIAAASVILTAGLAFGVPNRGRQAARAELLIISPLFMIGAILTLFAAKQTGIGLLGILMLPLTLTGIGLLAGSLFLARSSQGFFSEHGLRLFGSSCLALAAWLGAYVLWSRGVIGWNPALVFWLVSFVVATGVACHRPKAERDRTRGWAVEHSNGVATTVLLSVLFAYVGAVLALVVIGFLPSDSAAVFGLIPLAIAGGVVGFTTRRFLHQTKAPPPPKAPAPI